MRKLLISLLACALSLALLGSALAAPGDALLFVADQSMSGDWYSTSIDSIAALGDALYMSNYATLYVYRVGDEAPTELPYDEASRELLAGNRKPLADGETLYILSYAEQGILYTVRIEDGVATLVDPIELDWTGLTQSYDDYVYSREIADAQFIGGDLYVLLESEDYSKLELMRFDLASGSRRAYDVRDLNALCAYKEGYALLMLRDNERWDAPARLAMMDLAAGDVKELATFAGGGNSRADGLAYDAAADIIYYLLDGSLHAWQLPGEAQAIASAPLGRGWRGTTGKLLAGGYYAYGDYEGVLIRNTDPAMKAERTLTIQGNQTMDKAYQAFTAAYPDVDVILSSAYSTADEITQAMMNGSDAVDVYTLDVSSDSFSSMIGRGYAVDLSGSAKIAEMVGQMYPHIQQIVKREDRILAVPISYRAYGWGYQSSNLEKLGLTDEDMPTTYAQLCDLLNRWPDEFGVNFPEMQLMEPYMLSYIRTSMLSQLLTDYTMYMAHSGQELRYNTPLFKQLLTTLEGIDQSLYPEDEDLEGGYSYSWDDILFERHHSVTLGESRYNPGMKPLPLALTEDTPALYVGNMSVYLINPYSKNIDLASEYLEYALNNADELLMTALIPARNEPIPNPNYDRMYAEYQESVKQLQEMAENGTDEEKEYARYEYEAFLAYQEEYLAYIEQSKWLASAEEIARYRGLAEQIVVVTGDILGFYGGEQGMEIYSFIERYANGQMSADQMLSGIDQKIRMMQMEAAY